MAPEIPQNTGSIARLAAATACRLHLVRPLGFSLEDRYLRRAGLDYWPLVDWQVHDSWGLFLERLPAGVRRPWLFTSREGELWSQAPFAAGDYLLFGGESRGLPLEIRRRWPARCLRIPLVAGGVRSLNLAQAVAVATYTALGRIGRLPS